jgi:hypothetical protein
MMADMKRKRLLVVLFALVALAVAGAVTVLWPWPRVTKESYERIKLGMTRGEVEAILGVPPGDYTGGPTRSSRLKSEMEIAHDLSWSGGSPETWGEWWKGDAADVMVRFSPSGLAVWKMYRQREREEQTTSENIQWRLRRLVLRWFPP